MAGFCKFGDICSYNHQEQKQNEIMKKKSQLKQRNNFIFKFGPEAR